LNHPHYVLWLKWEATPPGPSHNSAYMLYSRWSLRASPEVRRNFRAIENRKDIGRANKGKGN